MNVGIAVHSYDGTEGTGGYVAKLLPHLATAHDVTLYTARVRAPIPDGVTVVRVPALMARAYTAILTFPAALQVVRRSHDLFHAQGWVSFSADVVTAHIVMAAWRSAAKAASVHSPPGERFLGGFVERREASLFRNKAKHIIAPSHKAKREIEQFYGRTDSVSGHWHGLQCACPRSTSFHARLSLRLRRD